MGDSAVTETSWNGHFGRKIQVSINFEKLSNIFQCIYFWTSVRNIWPKYHFQNLNLNR